MTSTATEAETTTADVDLSDYPDDTIAKLWAKVKASEPSLKELHDKVRKTTPPTAAEVDKIVAESEDDELAKMRTQIEKAEKTLQTLREKARKTVLDGYASVPEADVEAMREQFKMATDKVRNVVNLVASVAETLGYEDVVKTVAEYKIPTLRGVTSAARGSATGVGAGIPRIQVSCINIKQNGRELQNFTGAKAKLSYAAQYMKTVTRDQIQDAWISTASGGTAEDVVQLKWQEIKNPVEFMVGDYEVTIYPKGYDGASDEPEGDDGGSEE